MSEHIALRVPSDESFSSIDDEFARPNDGIPDPSAVVARGPDGARFQPPGLRRIFRVQFHPRTRPGGCAQWLRNPRRGYRRALRGLPLAGLKTDLIFLHQMTRVSLDDEPHRRAGLKMQVVA